MIPPKQSNSLAVVYNDEICENDDASKCVQFKHEIGTFIVSVIIATNR